jgi:diguanylate cyclase (GGDEF)-like protein
MGRDSASQRGVAAQRLRRRIDRIASGRDGLTPRGSMSSHPTCSLLVVDDEPYIRKTLLALLADEFEVVTAENAEAAQKIFAQRPIDLILSDQRMSGMKGVELLEWVRQNHPKTVRLLMTGFADLEDAVEAINRGKVFRYLFKPWRSDELLQVLRDASRSFSLERRNEQLMQSLREAGHELEQRVLERTQQLEQANHELQQKNLMLEKLALTDPLTCLPNRRALDQLVESEIRRRTRYPGPLALGIIDADNFKEINCRYLYPGGDQVLMDLAKVLNSSVRTVDTVGRLGGEEFMVVAPQTSLDGAEILGERIRAAVESYRFSYRGQEIRVTVSVGVAAVEDGMPADYDILKHVAAAALAEAKATGRNRSVVHALPVVAH